MCLAARMWASVTAAETCTPSACILFSTLESLLGLFFASEQSELPKTGDWFRFAPKGCEKSLVIGGEWSKKRGLSIAGRNWSYPSRQKVQCIQIHLFQMTEQQTWSSEGKTGDANPPISSFISPFSVCSLWLLCLPLFQFPLLSHSSTISHTIQVVTLLPHHTALPELHTVLPVNSHFMLPACSPVSCTSVEQQRRLKPDFLSSTIKEHSCDFSFLRNTKNWDLTSCKESKHLWLYFGICLSSSSFLSFPPSWSLLNCRDDYSNSYPVLWFLDKPPQFSWKSAHSPTPIPSSELWQLWENLLFVPLGRNCFGMTA